MGFKYKKFELREGEVLEPHRLRENMQTLAHEINGKIDRENLPLGCIKEKMVADKTFNEVIFEGRSSSAGQIYLSSEKTTQYESVLSKTIEVPVDGIVIVHYGAFFEWDMRDRTALHDLHADFATDWDAHFVEQEAYSKVNDNSLDFRLRINGEDVCEAKQFSFLRQKNSVYLCGCLPSVAGQVTVTVEVKSYQQIGDIQKQLSLFDAEIKNDNIVIQIKKR